jgi:aminopeptidase N
VEPYRHIAERLSLQDGVATQSVVDVELKTLHSASVLFSGGPAMGPLFDWVQKALPDGMSLKRHAFRVGGKEYREAGNALLLSIRNPDNPAHVVSIFYGLTLGAAKSIAPLLFFYGWNTYVVFENGKVIARSEDNDPQPRFLPADEKK